MMPSEVVSGLQTGGDSAKSCRIRDSAEMEKFLQGLPQPQLELPGYLPLLLWATSKGPRKSEKVLAMNLQALNCHQVMKGRKRLTNK